VDRQAAPHQAPGIECRETTPKPEQRTGQRNAVDAKRPENAAHNIDRQTRHGVQPAAAHHEASQQTANLAVHAALICGHQPLRPLATRINVRNSSSSVSGTSCTSLTSNCAK